MPPVPLDAPRRLARDLLGRPAYAAAFVDDSVCDAPETRSNR